MDYRREIDGLRALAVLPVILFHAGFETFSGGFVGVDVFFVISGYLITTIILSALEQGKFSILNFYERRARRILPALFLVMLVCIPFAWFLLLPGDMKDFSRSLVAVSVFASNILFWLESGYFETASELKPLLHTWSLAVEEQYYVLFPLFLMIFWKLGKRWILVTLGLIFLASLGLAQWAAYAKPSAAFYLLPTRGWELLIGAFAAFYLSQSNRKEFGKGLSELGGWLGIALILYAVFTYSKTTPFPGFYALVPTLGAVLIILFATQKTTAGKFVGNNVFVGIGLISYSAYLWHQPLFAFVRYVSEEAPAAIVMLMLCLLTFFLAYLSWKFVERPARRAELFPSRYVFYVCILGIFSFSLVGFLISSNSFGALTFFRVNPYSEIFERRGLESFSQFRRSDGQNVYLWGDSFADALSHPLAGVLSQNEVGLIGYIKHACPSLLNTRRNEPARFGENFSQECAEFNKTAISELLKHKDNFLGKKYVVITSAYSWYDTARNANNEKILSSYDNNLNNEDIVKQSLENTIYWLKQNGFTPILVLTHPTFDKFYEKLRSNNAHNFKVDVSNWRSLNHRLSSSLNHQDLFVIDPIDLLCGDSVMTCSAFLRDDSIPFVWKDGSHLSELGASLVANKILEIIKAKH